MKSRYFLKYSALFVICFIGEISAEEIFGYYLTEVESRKDTITYRYGEEKIVELWKLDHYSPKSGRLIGIWPYNFSPTLLYEYKTRWGYNGIFVTNKAGYKNAIDAGYKKENIIMNVAYKKGTLDYQDIIVSCDAGRYYIDEAVNHSCYGKGNKRLYYPEELRSLKEFIIENRKGSLFVSSGYKRCSHLDTLTLIADKIMYSGYSDWYLSVFPCLNLDIGWGASVEFAWLPGSDDQRSSWKDMKKRYGSKFSMTWINSYESNEFDDLFDEAMELGLNEVWIYTLDKPDSSQFENICNAAYKYGFLRRFLKKYLYTYKCICKKGCNGFQPENTECWQLEKEDSTDILKEE